MPTFFDNSTEKNRSGEEQKDSKRWEFENGWTPKYASRGTNDPIEKNKLGPL